MRARRPWSLGALGCLVLVAWAAPAAAHAAVTASSPAQGAHLARVPHTVTVDFDQPVQPDNGGLVVLDSAGQQVQVSLRRTRRRRPLQAVLPASLGPAPTSSDYTVTSVDGHVVSGGIVFLVGNVARRVDRRPRPAPDVHGDPGGRLRPVPDLPRACSWPRAWRSSWPSSCGAGEERRRLRTLGVRRGRAGLVGMVVTGGAQSVLTGGGLGSLAHWSIDTPVLRRQVRGAVRRPARRAGGLPRLPPPAHHHDAASSPPSTGC